MSVCHVCGIPADAGFFDDSNIKKTAPAPGEEIVLASYQLHRNHCGMLLYFAQFTRPARLATPGYQWQIRCDGQPRDPYLALEHVVNRWGLSGFPVFLRLEEGCTVEFVVRNIGASSLLQAVGGRILGRHWYNTDYGGAPNRL